AHGYRTGKIPATHNFDKVKLISRWSHRHIAHLAGLGTFGINNMLITESGCCGRFGSIITDCPVTIGEKQPVADKCLYKAAGKCGVCVRKCVNGALRFDGFDRHKCYESCLANEELHRSIGKADVCGKCTVGLPCSLSDPTAR
ncbi:MAG TPA: epoxyqueuosine reductase, partial [Spirochaetota bacterium]|nr:epoxyqueuosine reductase [Spirochaetota bacterium]